MGSPVSEFSLLTRVDQCDGNEECAGLPSYGVPASRVFCLFGTSCDWAELLLRKGHGYLRFGDRLSATTQLTMSSGNPVFAFAKDGESTMSRCSRMSSFMAVFVLLEEIHVDLVIEIQ